MAAQPRKIQKFDLHTLGTYPSLTQEMPDNEIQVIRKILIEIKALLKSAL